MFEPILSINDFAFQLGIKVGSLRDIAERVEVLYDPFDVRRDSTSKSWRHIDNPVAELKSLQTRIYKRLFAEYPFNIHVVGALPGRSIMDNATFHDAPPLLVTLDIAGCFPSIHDERHVFPMLRRLGFSTKVAGLLTRLTTLQNRLPQGAPTSPVIANLVLGPVHDELERISSDLGLNWSMFVDDIAVSGMRAREAIAPVIAVLAEHGFKVSRKKLEIAGTGQRQRITGIVVNRRPTVGRAFIQTLRSGILKASSEPEFVDAGTLASLYGKVQHVEWVNPTQGAVLRRFAERHLPTAPAGRGTRLEPLRRGCSSFSSDHSAWQAPPEAAVAEATGQVSDEARPIVREA